ncbi:MAG: hypothetical protein H7833_17380 [Magnetococcus sp. DMHC-1]|nr:hypothetical protein [Magnetococcales bacterium]
MQFYIQIPDELESRIQKIEDKQGYIIDAIRERLARDNSDYNQWAIEEIKSGLKEAERHEFVTNEEIINTFKKYGVEFEG